MFLHSTRLFCNSRRKIMKNEKRENEAKHDFPIKGAFMGFVNFSVFHYSKGVEALRAVFESVNLIDLTSPHRMTHPLSTPPISNKNLFLSVCFRNLSENMRGEVIVTSIFCCFVLPVIQSLCLGLPSIHFIKFFFIFRGRKRKWIFWPKINNKNSVECSAGFFIFLFLL